MSRPLSGSRSSPQAASVKQEAQASGNETDMQYAHGSGMCGVRVEMHHPISLNGAMEPHGSTARDQAVHPRQFPVYQTGRASCRESVCQYVKISVVAVSLKQKRVS